MYMPSTIRCLVRDSKRKRILWTKRLGLFIGIGLALMAQIAMSQDSLIEEIRTVREKDRSANILINDLITKYVPIGTNIEVAQSILEKHAFKCTKEPERSSADGKTSKLLYCNYDFRKWYNFGFGDEVAVYFFSEDRMVRRISARLLYEAL